MLSDTEDDDLVAGFDCPLKCFPSPPKHIDIRKKMSSLKFGVVFMGYKNGTSVSQSKVGRSTSPDRYGFE